MNDFKIERVDTFEETLSDIAVMIAGNFGYDVMDSSLAMIEEHISQLTNPEIGSDKFPALARKGYKVLVIPHNYVIYTVDYRRKVVTLRLIIDDRQELYGVISRYSLL